MHRPFRSRHQGAPPRSRSPCSCEFTDGSLQCRAADVPRRGISLSVEVLKLIPTMHASGLVNLAARKYCSIATFSGGVGKSGNATICVRCGRSEEHTSELQSLMRISYAVFCLNKKIK